MVNSKWLLAEHICGQHMVIFISFLILGQNWFIYDSDGYKEQSPQIATTTSVQPRASGNSFNAHKSRHKQTNATSEQLVQLKFLVKQENMHLCRLKIPM